VQKAAQRLRGAERPLAADEHVRAVLAPTGIRINASGESMMQAAALANAVAQAYRDERSDGFVAPPGCKALSVSVAEQARPADSSLFSRRLGRCTLAALLLGLAGALMLSGRLMKIRDSVMPLFLFSLASICGLGLLTTNLSSAQAPAGATILALLLATAAAFTEFVISQKVRVSPRFLRFTAITFCAMAFGMGGCFRVLVVDQPESSALVRLSVQNTGATEELPLTYSSRFIATECAVISSKISWGNKVDEGVLGALRREYGYSLMRMEGQELIRRITRARAVPGTSIIEIRLQGPRAGPGRTASAGMPGAGLLAGAYQDYWRQRSETNLPRHVSTTLLNSGIAFHPRVDSGETQALMALTVFCLLALVALSGVYAVALLDRRPGRLWVFPTFGTAYIFALGFSAVISESDPDTHVARCLVRVWPPSDTGTTSGEKPREAIGKLLRYECDLARSEVVESNTVRALNWPTDLSQHLRDLLPPTGRPERKRSLQRCLDVYPVEGTFLLAFRAVGESAAKAAELANTAAASYCGLRHAGVEPTVPAWWKPDVEIVEKAEPVTRLQRSSHSLTSALGGGLVVFVLPFMVGATLGWYGCHREKVRRPRRTRRSGLRQRRAWFP
jgi:hypothetical protein